MSSEVTAIETTNEIVKVSVGEPPCIASDSLGACQRADDFGASDSVVTGREDSRNGGFGQFSDDDANISIEKEIENSRDRRKRNRNNRRRGKAPEENDCLEKNIMRGGVLQYSRKEMEDLRYVNLEEQKKRWIEMYCGLGQLLVQEYEGLLVKKKKQNKRQQKNPSILGPCDLRPQFHESTSLEGGSVDEIGSFDGEGDEGEGDESDEDYTSLQRPAFFVSGDPDFDSGPPQDGLEYLRRVRWEAARIPKVVKVVGHNRTKEQSVYMPQIPDIMKCSDKLLPLKEWEQSFLVEFSELRQAVAHHLEDDDASDLVSGKLEETSDVEMHSAEGLDRLLPTLSCLRKISPAARITMLKKRINSIQSSSEISRGDGLWLFSLCAAVDCPLDGDSAAAMRSLLRKCCSLRAAKSEVDEELIVLNLLVAISGTYFGQQEKW